MTGMGNMMGGGKQAAILSDRRLKTSVVKIGALPSGISVYRFKFIGSDAEHIGVMADEVEKVIPEAVSKNEAGYYMVDYRKIH